MQVVTKVVLNTIVLYVKIMVSMVIALVSVPLILKALGASDYGLYNLVAGIVTMLAFLNNSMTVSSQRYMSVAMGEGNNDNIDNIYNTSFILHLILAFIVFICLEIIGVPSISNLNIESDRIWCAQLIFQFLVISTFSKIISVPFDAIMNAHEDMLAFSVIELTESGLMLTIAIVLQYIPIDKLAFYGFCIALIALFTLFMKYGWCKLKYRRYQISFRRKIDRTLLKDMSGFAGWNLFGGLALMGRNQGVAIVFNLFLGTLANAAYGVANHINGALSQFSSTFQRAINPQLMKSEGMRNRKRLFKIALITSKFSILALSLFAIPLIVLMDDVLLIWLNDNIPPYTSELAQCILVMSIVTQGSMGLMSAIQATGQIKNYQITMGCLILTNVPLAYILLKLDYPIYYVTIGFIIIEMISLIVRIFMAKHLMGLSIQLFFRNVIYPVVLVIIVSLIACLIPYYLANNIYLRLISVCVTYGITYLIMMWFFALEKEQRKTILSKFKIQ